MLHPSYTDLMKVVNKDVEEGATKVVNSRYSIVLATAKRARQIIDGEEVLVQAKAGQKPLSIAIEEVNQAKIKIVGEEGSLDLYDDDGVSLDYQKGIYNIYHINYKDNMLIFETKHKKYDTTYKTICIEKNELKKTIPFNYSFKLEI